MAPTREERLVQTLVELADTLVDDFDVIEFLHMLTQRATEMLDAVEAGLLLADPGGNLQLMASSSERTRALELFQLQNEEGPCLDCYRTGQPVIAEDLNAERDRWPRFVPEACKDGFASGRHRGSRSLRGHARAPERRRSHGLPGHGPHRHHQPPQPPGDR
jgi:GAF domain-containing protein